MTEDQEMLISLLDLNSSTSDALLKLPADLVDMKNTLTNEKTHYENFVATQRDLSVKEHQALKKLREEAEGLNLSIHLPSNVSHSDVAVAVYLKWGGCGLGGRLPKLLLGCIDAKGSDQRTRD